MPVVFGQAGKGDMLDIEIEAHAHGIGRHEVIDLARLVHRHLGVARLRAERAHDHRRAAAKAPQHFGHDIDLLGRKRDDRAARGMRLSFLAPTWLSVEKRGRVMISASGTRAFTIGSSVAEPSSMVSSRPRA
jgi:hypothetical protein